MKKFPRKIGAAHIVARVQREVSFTPTRYNDRLYVNIISKRLLYLGTTMVEGHCVCDELN